MKKLTLAIEELEVTSFETDTKDGERGTVAAHGASGLTCPYCRTVLTYDCCTPIA